MTLTTTQVLMSAVKTDQSEGTPGAGIPEQAVKKMLSGSATLSLPSPFPFFSHSFSQFTLSPLSRSLEQANSVLLCSFIWQQKVPKGMEGLGDVTLNPGGGGYF